MPAPAPAPSEELAPAPVANWHETPVDLSVPVVRKSAHHLSEEEQERIAAAWRKMTENKDGKPGTSEYFRLGLIHGGSMSSQTRLQAMQNPQPNYCVHGPECFPNWHRVYMTDIELTLRRADLALGNDGRIFLPYFDWTVKPEGKPMLPAVLQKIMATDSHGGTNYNPPKRSEGGLFHGAFLPLDTDGNQLAPREEDGTLFYKTMRWTDELDAELEAILTDTDAGRLGGWGAHEGLKAGETLLLPSTRAVLRSANHRQASSALEANPHGWIHVAVGMLGNELPGTEMVGAVPTAGFHPIFWMHHCNVDRVYESFLHTEVGRTAQQEWRGRLEERLPHVTTAVAFPDGEWGRLEPFGVNPATGEQYHTRDTFDTAGMGFTYDALYALPDGPPQMREMPVVCVFRDIQKLRVTGSKSLFVYVSDGGWEPPAELTPLKPAQLKKLPGYAGFAGLFVFGEAAKCDNCLKNSPLVTVTLEVTAALRAQKLGRAKAKVHAIAYDLATKTSMTLEAAGVEPPTLEGPAIEGVGAAVGESADDVAALQALLNDDDVDRSADGRPGAKLAVDGVMGPATIEAVKRAQAAAGLEPTGVVDAATKRVLRVAQNEELNPDAEGKEATPHRPTAGSVIRWRLAEGTVPPSLGSVGAVSAELAAAFAEWDAAMEGVTFERVKDKDKEAAQVTLRFEDRTPQNKLAFDGPGGALAATTPSAITFDSAERWELMAADGAAAHPQRSILPDDYFFKLLPVALHEIGHLFGMGHSSEPADVMSPFYNATVKLSDNDKARIAELLKESSVSA